MNTNKKILCALYPKDKVLTRTWFVSYSISGAPAKKKYGALNDLPTVEEREKEAERLIKLIEKEAEQQTEDQHNKQGITQANDPGPDLLDKRQLILAFEEAFDERKPYLRPDSVNDYSSHVQSFLIWFRTSKYETFSVDALKAFVKALRAQQKVQKKVNKKPSTTVEKKPGKGYRRIVPLSNTTINFKIGVIKSFLEDLITKQIIRVNPLEGYRKLPECRKSYAYFEEELQPIVAKAIAQYDAQLWLLCEMQYYTLIRPQELQKLKIGDINLRQGSVRVDASISKNKKTQYVRIPDCFIERLRFIENYPSDYFLFSKLRIGGPSPKGVGRGYFTRHHRIVLQALHLDVDRYVCYSWKHTGAVMFYLATKDLKALKEQGRWHSLDMVEEYLKNLGVLDMDTVKERFPAIKKHADPILADSDTYTSVA